MAANPHRPPSRLRSAVARPLLAVLLLAAGVATTFSGCGSAERYAAQRVRTADGWDLSTPSAEAEAVAAGPRGSVYGNGGYRRAVTGANLNALVPPESLPAAGEELWVIEKRPAGNDAAAAADASPRTGALLARLAPDDPPDRMKPCPLAHTDVRASVAGYFAAVDVTQRFQNPFAEKIEAVYVFPLPANAAVNGFVMTVGDRRIRGVVREREQAKQIYEAAKQQGYVASLLKQDRPNVFTQAVANIEPGKRVDVSIRYYHTLPYADGWYELAFPMVVGPRFNPPGSTDGIGAVGPGGRGASAQAAEVSYLPPGTRSGHDVSLAVDLDAGVAYEEIRSVNHSVKVDRRDARHAAVTLDKGDSIPNKDFVLRWRVASDRVKAGLIAARPGGGFGGSNAGGERWNDGGAPIGGGSGGGPAGVGHFALMVVPPARLRDLPAGPLEFVFTLDVSGSMTGRPIEQAKAAMRCALEKLGPDDRFQVVKFASSAEQMAPAPIPATPRNVERAMRYVRDMDAGGGTMMLDGMRKSLDAPRDPARTRIVCFLTDGYIGNEADVLGAMHEWLGDARVFSFGVGSSTNRYLLDHMAKLGRGAAAYVAIGDDPAEPMAAFFDRVRHAAVTDLAVDFAGMNARDVYPRQLPDLLVGRPVVLTGRYDGPAAGGDLPSAVRVTGRAAGQAWSLDVPVRPAGELAAAALPSVWARGKIADLADEATYRRDVDLAGGIKRVALEYGLMSGCTSFVAVDAARRTAGDHGVTTIVPVPVPDGVRYDTTVTEAKAVVGTPEVERD
ncbi:MAG: marine proteobacterial sortase target protein [Phycisphaerales bacterium]|nr:marine proteobacterial sortase target protein [Phycisphaerales bacterium]